MRIFGTFGLEEAHITEAPERCDPNGQMVAGDVSRYIYIMHTHICIIHLNPWYVCTYMQICTYAHICTFWAHLAYKKHTSLMPQSAASMYKFSKVSHTAMVRE